LDQAKTRNYMNMELSSTASDLNQNLYVEPTKMLDSTALNKLAEYEINTFIGTNQAGT